MNDHAKICMIGVFILAGLIMLGMFVTEWVFMEGDDDIFNDTVVGVLIGTPLGWIGAYTAFYTTQDRPPSGG